MSHLALLPAAPTASAVSRYLGHYKGLLPGVALSLGVAEVAMQSGRVGWFATHGLSALTVAIVPGILLGNTIYGRIAAASGPGVVFSKQTVSRAGVVLYGLRLTLSSVAHVGTAAVVIDAVVLTSTFGLALLLGTRVLGLDRFHPPHTYGSTHGGSRVIRETAFEHPRYVPLARRAYENWRRLEAETGESLLHVTGVLYLSLIHI